MSVAQKRKRHKWQPLLELLEDRLVPATYTVNSIGDTGGGSGLAGDLRYCITQADADPGSTIVFDATVFASTQAITLNGTELPVITQNLTITGPTASLTISGAGQSRVFEIGDGTHNPTVSLSNLTLAGGSASGDGGGILRNGTGALTLSNCTLTDNTATVGGGGIASTGTLRLSGCTLGINSASSGGGILSDGGSLTLTGCYLGRNSASLGGGLFTSGGQATLTYSRFYNNIYGSAGGAIDNGGSLKMTQCTLDGNVSAYLATDTSGGGLYNTGSAALDDCEVGGSDADRGAGIANSGTLAVSNSTLFGRAGSGSGPGSGGGLYNSGTATLTNCTLSGDMAYDYQNGTTHIAGTGGGIDNLGTLTLNNTLVAGNSAAGAESDIQNSGLVLGDYDLTGDGSAPGPHSLRNTNPLLTFDYYDGRYTTLAPLPGSPALDAGSNALAVDTSGNPLTYDERDYKRVVNGTVDIGAVESGGFTITVLSGDNQTGPTNAAFPTALRVRVTANQGRESVQGGVVTFTAPADGPSGTFAGGSGTATIDYYGNATAPPLTANGVGGSSPGTGGSYTVTASVSDAAAVPFHLTNVVPVVYTVTSTGDTGAGSGTSGDLRYCITQADTVLESVIVFDPTVFATAQTISLGGALPDLSEGMQIDSPTAGVTVNAAGHSRVFVIDAGAIVSISGLTITGGASVESGPFDPTATGGGINNRGTLTLTNCTLSGNTAGGPDGGGGGVANTGSLALNNCTLQGNSAVDMGGGLFNYMSGTATLTDCTLSGNTATYGGNLESSGTATLTDCTLSGGFASQGGGLENDGATTLTGCTLSGNSASNGGGLFNSYVQGESLWMGNCTLAGNTAGNEGGGLFNLGSATVTNCTVADNTAGQGGGGLLYATGDNQPPVTIQLGSTIVAGNSANGTASDVRGTVQAWSCLIQSTSGTTLTWDSFGTITGQDPQLAPLGNYGGPTQTMALRPGSPALDAGFVPYFAQDQNGKPLATDQRGLPRSTRGTVDIGAYQLQGTITVNSTADTNTRDNVLTLREALLVVGGTLMLSDLTAAERQQVAVDPGEPGAYVIVFDSTVFATAQTITLAGTPLPEISQSVTIDGPVAPPMTEPLAIYPGYHYSPPPPVGVTLDAGGHSRVLAVDAGAALTISHLTITGGSVSDQGGAITNNGTLTLNNSTLTGNIAYQGGAIVSSGVLTLDDSTLRGNSAAIGGGIDNLGGSLALTDCTLAGNSASFGGGLENAGTVTLTECTLSGNTAETAGGGLSNRGTATLTNCTVSGNTADQGGGLFNNAGSLSLTNCTVSGNTTIPGGADIRGAGLYTAGGPATLLNTLVAGNSAAGAGSDVSGTVSAQYSLIQNLAGTAFTVDSGHNILGQNPLLGPLGNYRSLGLTQTVPLLPGSPAIDAGTSTGAPAFDQRSQFRIGAVDIGAFESQGFSIGVGAGANQSTPVGTAFPTALVVQVFNPFGEPVQGGVVTFTTPAGGAAGTFAGGQSTATVTIDASGTATAPALTANNTTGAYTVTATTAGAAAVSAFAAFPLLNTPVFAPPPAPPTSAPPASSPPATPPTPLTPPGLDANGRFVYHLYQDLLGRQPGPDEANFFGTALDQGTLTQAQVASFFASSPEFHEHQIDQLYVRLLGRHVDAATAALFAAGGNLGQIEAVILGSDEYSQLHGGTPAGFLAGLGQDVFGGSLDPADLGLFQSELASGTPRFAVALQAVAEPQAAAAEAGRLYQQILRRSASASELAVPAALVLQGDEADLLLALLLSEEFAKLP